MRLFVGADTVSQVAAAGEGCGSAALCVSCTMRVVAFLVCIMKKRADVAGHNSKGQPLPPCRSPQGSLLSPSLQSGKKHDRHNNKRGSLPHQALALFCVFYPHGNYSAAGLTVSQ
jgi:hypothetical protein